MMDLIENIEIREKDENFIYDGICDFVELDDLPVFKDSDCDEYWVNLDDVKEMINKMSIMMVSIYNYIEIEEMSDSDDQTKEAYKKSLEIICDILGYR